MNGELVRGHDHIAGEFGHIPLSLRRAPLYVRIIRLLGSIYLLISLLSRAILGGICSNSVQNSLRDAGNSSFTVLDLVARARAGDAKALGAIQATARFLGLGLGSIVNTVESRIAFTWLVRSLLHGI